MHRQTMRRSTTPTDAEPHWYACYTRSRHEKRVDSILAQRGIEAFLPLIPRERQWHDRKKVVLWPLFPSYVFARCEREGLSGVLSTPGVAEIVRFNGTPARIADTEIANIRRFANRIRDTGLEPQLTPMVGAGQRVRVVSGPLAGVEGRVLECRGRGRALIVGLEAIRQGLKLEVDTRLLRIIEDS